MASVKRMSVEVMEKKATAARVKGGRVGGGEGVRSNGAEIVVSEVSADIRFLRISKSYSTITNRVMSVALTKHNEVGVHLVAGDGVSLTPLDVTDTYKSVELQRVPTHRLPTRDCSVEVGMKGEGVRLGDKVELTVTVANHGHMLRTLDGRVEGRTVRCGNHHLTLWHSFISAFYVAFRRSDEHLI